MVLWEGDATVRGMYVDHVGAFADGVADGATCVCAWAGHCRVDVM